MTARIAIGLSAALLIAVGLLFGRVQDQQGRIEALSTELRALQDVAPAEPGSGARELDRRPIDPGPLARGQGDVAVDVVPSADRPTTLVDPLRPGEGTRAVVGEGPARSAEEVHAALVEMLDSDDPDIRGRVQGLIRREQEEVRDQRRQVRQQRWEQDTVDRLDKLAADTNLSAQQQDALFAILTVARDRATEAFRSAREDHSFGEARQKAQQYSTEADAEARELLDDTQYEAYKIMREEDADRRGFRREAKKPSSTDARR